jgi:hypothetical protein
VRYQNLEFPEKLPALAGGKGTVETQANLHSICFWVGLRRKKGSRGSVQERETGVTNELVGAQSLLESGNPAIGFAIAGLKAATSGKGSYTG